MMICTNCQKSFSNDFSFCPICGNELKNQVVCSKCKKELDDNFKFCPYCGTSVTISGENEPSLDKKDVISNKESNNILEKQEELSITQLKKKAEQGDVESLLKLAHIYESGEGTEEDKEEAFYWYEIAAKRGYGEAQYAIAKMYYNGEGIEINKYNAFEWFIKAAETGYDLAIKDLDKKFGVTEDSTEEEIEQIRGNLLLEIGNLYFNEQSDEFDYSKAIEWYSKAVKHGNKKAKNIIENKIIQQLKEKSDQGDVSAQFELGQMYDEGKGIAVNKEEAFKWYLKAAEQNNEDAQYAVAEMYYDGEGVQANKYEAFEWYMKAWRAGDALAEHELDYKFDITEDSSEEDIERVRRDLLLELGNKYAHGSKGKIDIKKAFEYYAKAAEHSKNDIDYILEKGYSYLEKLKRMAEQGNESAQLELGNMYDEGKGVGEDKEEAFKWYMMAAEQGNAEAEYNVGCMYESGKGVGVDKGEAFKWYMLAAEQEHEDAQCAIADMYYDGEGVEVNKYEAFEWYLKADYAPCIAREELEEKFGVFDDTSEEEIEEIRGNLLLELADQYFNGIGVKQDFNKALEYYHKAAEHGNEEAKEFLEKDYVDLKLEYLKTQAEKGNADSQFELGLRYDEGKGVGENKEEAFNWYMKAAKQGHSEAQFCIGCMYELGESIEEDKEEALKWYLKSAEQGYEDAQLALGRMYFNGEGTEVNKYEAFEWYKKAADAGDFLAEDELESEFGITKDSTEEDIEKVRGELLFELGEKCFNRDGIKKDINKAIIYYRKAVDHGNGDAKNVLDNEIGELLAIEQLKESAKLGDVKAQVKLADMYKDGDIDDDNLNAFKWYIKAAEQGEAKAQFEIGEMYFNGYGEEPDEIKEDVEEALKWYMKAAEQGYVDAQLHLGYIYRYGDRVEEDKEKAFNWYMKAAEQGNTEAQCNIGDMYFLGDGIEENDKKAFEWYKKAAERGDGEGQFEIGRMYYNGYGIEKDIKNALIWYKKAAEQGYREAQYKLAELYYKGIGVEQDHSKAAELLTAAAEKGHKEAQYSLGVMYESGDGVPFSYSTAFKWYLKVAERGNEKAQAKVSNYYFAGKGVAPDYKKAAMWCLRAAEKLNPVSQNIMGVMYEHGYGVPQNLEKAIAWYYKAVKQGYEEACKNLEKIEKKLEREKLKGVKYYIVRYHLRDSREIKQTIFYDKSQAEAYFNKRGDNDAFNYSRIELLECDEGNIKELAKKRFEVMYTDDY